MGNPRPKKQRADYKGMNIEKLFDLLDERLPKFSMNYIHQGGEMPVMVNWQHQDPEMQEWEQKGFHLKTGTYRDLRGALTAMLERRDAYEEFVEDEKKRVKKNERRRQMSLLDKTESVAEAKVYKVEQGKVVEVDKKDKRALAFEKEMADGAALNRAILSVIASDPLPVK